jgi:hypothetical protein
MGRTPRALRRGMNSSAASHGYRRAIAACRSLIE